MSAKTEPRIVVLSTRGIFRDSVVHLLQEHGFSRTSGHATLPDLRETGPLLDLILVDLDSRGGDIDELFETIHRERPLATAVAIGTPLQLAAQAGKADGWIEERTTATARRLSDVASAVAKAHHRRVHFAMPADVERQRQVWESLTRRERQVLGLISCGIDNGEIGTALGISERAAKAHVTRLFMKFKVDRRAKLAIVACLAGLCCPLRSDPHLGRSASAP